jgi:hypothetical protein
MAGEERRVGDGNKLPRPGDTDVPPSKAAKKCMNKFINIGQSESSGIFRVGFSTGADQSHPAGCGIAPVVRMIVFQSLTCMSLPL